MTAIPKSATSQRFLRLTFIKLLPAELLNRFDGGSTSSRLARGAFWNFIGTIAGRALTLPTAVILARLMGREGYGELAIIFASIEFFGAFAGFSLGMTATKHVAEFRTRDP